MSAIASGSSAGIALVVLLALSPLRAGLEATMAMHMLVQIPLLVVAGALLGPGLARFLDSALARVDPSGIAMALIAVFASSYWMLPRALDAALAEPWMEAAKFVTLPLLVGLPLWLCRPRISVIAAGFIVANVLSMFAAVGWLYRAYPARLCNYYLIDDQVLAGDAIICVAAILAVLWLMRFFFGARIVAPAAPRHETCA